jgi:hypothetical protein
VTGSIEHIATMPKVATYRQVVVLDIVWRRRAEQPPEIDWASELSQALNESSNYSGTLWEVVPGPVERLVARSSGPRRRGTRSRAATGSRPGCDHCYALTLAARLKRMGQPRYQRDGDPRTSGPGFGLTLHEDKLDEPLRWRKPRVVFVNSMSRPVPQGRADAEFIARVFGVMAATPQHTYQVLTKRPKRMAGCSSTRSSRTSCAARAASWATRCRCRTCGSARRSRAAPTSGAPTTCARRRPPVRFISAEPLLGPLRQRRDP